jgi:hypothetical protein
MARVSHAAVRRHLDEIFLDDMHAKRVRSLASGVTGVMTAASLCIAAIGKGLAEALDLEPKHAIKQVDRLLSNCGLAMAAIMTLWLRYSLRGLKEAVVAMDWTDFAKSGHSTLAIHLVTKHGRAWPLMWWTVPTGQGKGWRDQTERDALRAFAAAVPEDVSVILLADRGFGSQDLYELLVELGIEFVIRFRGNIYVETLDGKEHLAQDWVPTNGRARLLQGAMVTKRRTPIPSLVFVKAKNMKEGWCLASSLSNVKAAQIVNLYGRRFTIEEAFRDTKNARFGLGLSDLKMKRPERRDRLILLGVLAQALLTLLGAACEETGLDRRLRANTVKKRTHSLLTQGLYWYGRIPNMREEWLRPLMEAFGRLVQQHEVFALTLGFEMRG